MQLGGGGGGGGGGSRKAGSLDKKSMWSTSEAASRHHHHHHHFRQAITSLLLFFMVALSCAVLYRSASPFEFFPASFYPSSISRAASSVDGNLSSSVTRDIELERVLKNASMSSRTVIITTLNEAWAAPNSIFDLFLESFRIGNQTKRLLDHLVVIALDKKAYARCSELHPHCYVLSTEGMDFSEEAYFMTTDYLKMMWRRIDFLRVVLDLGYNFIFTDADIMWFRNPFPHFHSDADFQIACDSFKGKSFDLNNKPNGGFTYVKSNTRTTHFYKFWYTSRQTYPGLHDQDVLNKIKYDPYITKIGLSIRFLETSFFGGFCEPSKDFNQVCTMHANCCIGLDNKVHDLRVMLDDWRNFTSAKWNTNPSHGGSTWRVPQRCGAASFHTPRKIVNRGTKRR